jgi:undecaprenyl-phosphate 4-deoxy-4-formamido-L-arabinose transferase
LASIVAIFSGVQLFALGIIGEYLARMHLRTMDRPPYVVGEEAGQPVLPTSPPGVAATAPPAQQRRGPGLGEV